MNGTAASTSSSSSSSTTEVRLWQKLVAGALGVIACISLAQTAPRDWWLLFLPLGLLVLSAVTVHLPKLGPQLLSRAIWWSNLALGVVLAVVGGRNERLSGVVMAIACGAAILVIGRKGLAEASASEGYTPVAFRSSLFLLMVFALADAQTFLLFACVSLSDRHHLPSASLMFVSGIAYVIGFIGLYRLKVWGAIVGVVTSALTFGVMIGGLVELPHELAKFLGIVTFVHCLVAAPMLIAASRGKTLPPLPPKARVIGSNAVICALMLVAVVAYVTR